MGYYEAQRATAAQVRRRRAPSAALAFARPPRSRRGCGGRSSGIRGWLDRAGSGNRRRGFIGSHLVDALIVRGHAVRIFDNLEAQVHGALRDKGHWPEYANPGAEYVAGDVRDREALVKALCDIDVVYHLAAATGVGQSMYQIGKYVEVNIQGTANLLDAVATVRGAHRPCKLIVASSRAVYGEGAYRCECCGTVHPPVRTPAHLDAGRWEPSCPLCGGPVEPAPTPESGARSRLDLRRNKAGAGTA